MGSTPDYTSNDTYQPRSVEAEEAVLGAVLVNPDAFYDVRADARLEARHFFIERHGWLWRVYERLVERGDPIDYTMVCSELEAVGKLAEFGGASAVLALINKTPNALNATGYGRIVVRMWWRREKLHQLQRAARLVQAESLDIMEIDSQIRDMLAEHAITGSDVQPARRLFGRFDEDYRRRREDAGDAIDAGLFEFNAVFAGRHRLGEYTIIQGLANIGKSFMAAQLAVAASRQVPVLYFTFEGVAEDVRDRMVAIAAGVPLDEIASGDYRGDHYERAFQIAMSFAERRIDVVDSLTDVKEVRRQVEAAILRHDFERPLVFIDNLNNIADAMPGKPYDNLSRVSAEVLQLVRQTGAGVVALAQQSNLYDPSTMRGVDVIKRALTPSMRTVEGSRKLAQHPHNLYGLYSADYIGERITRAEFDDPDCPPGHMVLMNCRQRNARGAVSAVVRWNTAIPRFESKQVGR